MATVKREKDANSHIDPIDISYEEMRDVAAEFMGDDAELLEDEGQYLDGNWVPEIIRRSKVTGKDVPETVNITSSRESVRVAAESFVITQKNRIRLENQLKSVNRGYSNKPNDTIDILDMFLEYAKISEANAKTILDVVTSSNPICRWMRSNVGVGPIIAAQLFGYLDFDRASHASNFISIAGLNSNNRPKLSKEEAAKIVDDVIGDKDGDDITDEMLMEIAVRSKWSYEYIRRKAVGESKIKSLCKKDRLIESVMMVTDKTDEPANRDALVTWIEQNVQNPSVTNEHLVEASEKFNIPYDILFEIAVPQSTKAKIAGDGNRRSKEQICKAISVYPYNKTLKTVMYKLAQSFLYQSNNPNCFYGKLLKQRLQYEITKNDAGDYAEQAAEILRSKNFSKNTAEYRAYSGGRLPSTHIMARVMRWTAKVFTNHLYEAMYVYYHQTMDYPKYYAVAHMGHHDVIYPAVSYDMLLNENLPISQRNLNPKPIPTK